MSNNENKVIISGNSDDFDLFATPADTHLAEELQKGTFEWSNKYTKVLGVLTLVVALLSAGAWYGHHSATSGTTATASSLRSAFARFAGASSGSASGGTSGSGFSGFSGGAGFGTRITGSIASVSGSTVTITLADPTQASSLKAGDNARITDTGAAGASGGFAAPGVTPPSASPSGSSTTSGSSKSGAAKPRSGSTSSAPSTGAPSAHSPSAGGAGSGRGGGFFSNPAFTACLTKAGVTITAGSRPNFQDPATASAIQSCMKSLGITFGGGGGGGGFGGAGGGAPSGAAGSTTTP